MEINMKSIPQRDIFFEYDKILKELNSLKAERVNKSINQEIDALNCRIAVLEAENKRLKNENSALLEQNSDLLEGKKSSEKSSEAEEGLTFALYDELRHQEHAFRDLEVAAEKAIGDLIVVLFYK